MDNRQSKTVTHERRKTNEVIFSLSPNYCQIIGGSFRATGKEKRKEAQGLTVSCRGGDESSGRLRQLEFLGQGSRKGELQRKSSWNLKRKPFEALPGADHHTSGLTRHTTVERPT